MLRRQNVTRYITPLREGGSLPALVDADDGFKYVIKFRGSGHGSKVLVAELIGALTAKALSLNVPEIVLLDVDEDFGRTEADEEIQDLLRASRGLNAGLHFLDGSLTLDPYVNPVDEKMASMIVWLDAYLTNVDRTIRNTNMLRWHSETWLIDHGAMLYFHHDWSTDDRPDKAALSPFPFIKDHALLYKASRLAEADDIAHRRLTSEVIDPIIDSIPEDWLHYPESPDLTPAMLREGYRRFMKSRLDNSHIFIKQANDARQALI